MNLLRQLLRSPVLTAVLFVFLFLSAAFISLSIEVYSTADRTAGILENRFSVIAYPNSDWNIGSPKYTAKAKEFVSRIEHDSDIVQKVHSPVYTNGNSRGLRTLLSFEEDRKYHSSYDFPYNYAVLEVEIGKVNPPAVSTYHDIYLDDEGVVKKEEKQHVTQSYDARLLDIIKIHPGYTVDASHIEVSFVLDDPDPSESHLEEGKVYYVYGEYSDIAKATKSRFARILNIPADRIMDYYVPYTKEEIKEHLEAREKAGCGNLSESPVGEIYYPETHGIQLTENHLKLLDTFLLEADGFFDRSDKNRIEEILDLYELCDSQIPVVGTDEVEKIFEFHLREFLMTSGRGFTSEECSGGKNVCIVSEMLASANNLSIGDTIDLACSINPNQDYRGILSRRQPVPEVLMPQIVLADTAFSRVEPFKIVGMYQIKNAWDHDYFSLTPNTIFVPRKTIESVSIPLSPAVFHAIEMKKDREEEFLRRMGEAHVGEESIRVIDNGYAEIKPIIRSFRESAMWLLIAGVSVCIVIMFAYLLFFVLRKKRDIGLMISLGASRRFAAGQIFWMSMFPLLAASLAGGFVGMSFVGAVVGRIYRGSMGSAEIGEGAMEILSAPVSASLETLGYHGAIGVLCQVFVYAVAIWITIHVMTKKSPLRLLKG